ncbi:hypothetical protein GCM10027169_12980 [Gordonia jinhuaensis]|uniref:Uncharacterized protein n=1 Tax=Gordonia jinhuaensis TaxID=1517702 RepID=A0A916SXQ9_9ACTN|nr:hypothetical protein GCM10011489_08320 [Gordonia jinhuaensis]
MNPRDAQLSDGELLDLAGKLDAITIDLVDRLVYLATEPMPRLGVAGPHVRSQPCSRPPYNIGAEIILDKLGNELSTTVRHLCEHRGQEVPTLGSIVELAGWLRKHRVAIATMPDARDLHDALCRVCDEARRAAHLEEREYRISQAMVDEANRQLVTSQQIVKLAHKLGDQGKGLSYERVRTLRRRGGLTVAYEDAETGTLFYRLGDVLAAHSAYRRRSTKNAVK